MSLTTTLRRAAAATLALGVASGLGLAVADSAQAVRSDSLGKVFVTPTPGDGDTYPTIATSGVCPDTTSTFRVTLDGPAFPADAPGSLIGKTDYGLAENTAGGGKRQTAVVTMKEVFSSEGVAPVAGDYTVTWLCQNTRGSVTFGSYEGVVSLTVTNGKIGYTQASDAKATTTVVSASPASPAAADTPTTLTATVTPAAAGTVQFKRGTASVGAAQRLTVGASSATASLSLQLAQGAGDLTAVFTPDDTNSFQPSTSAPVPYTVVEAPTVTGSAAVDGTLTCGTGTVGTPSFQWLVDGQPAAGFTGRTAKAPVAWQGKPVRCRVTTAADGGSVTQLSNTVTIGVGAALKPTTTPSISGTAKVGKTLTCKPGAWSPKATSYAYQWLKAGKKIAGATKATYKVAKADKGKALTCTVTAKAAGHKDGVATTKAVKVS